MRSAKRKAPRPTPGLQIKWALAGFAAVIVAAVVVLSVTDHDPARKAWPGTQARWERTLGWSGQENSFAELMEPAHGDRELADAPPRCLKDRVADPQWAKQEALRLEKARGGSPVSGTWMNLDLSTMPPTQAQYLSANADWIADHDGSQPISFSSCSDLPCVLNQVYGSGATYQGWKIYYFYLATGYSISLRDFVPRPVGRWSDKPLHQLVFDAPLSAHLFSDTELFSFWKLSYLLPDAYRNMVSLRFHRVPSGKQVPDEWLDKDGKPRSICADTWGNDKGAFIRAQRCLEEDSYAKHVYADDDNSLPDNGIRGEFYLNIFHEMTHAWDIAHSDGVTPQGYASEFSDKDEWKSLSGWHDVTLTSSTGAGVSISRWAAEPGKTDDQGLTYDGFVRAYAGTNPKEDLAETAAWVRFRPEGAAAMSPRKTALISEKLFGGRTYDAAGLAEYYTNTAVNALTPAKLLEVVKGCLASSDLDAGGATGAVAGAASLTLDAPLPQFVVNCLESQLNGQITSTLEALRGTEWEACDVLDKNGQEAKVRSDVLARVSPDVSRYVSQNIDRAALAHAAQQLETTLGLQVDPREAYAHCFRQAQPEACYQQALSDAFDHVAQGTDDAGRSFVSVLGDTLASEKTAFLGQNSFEQSKAKSLQFYGLVFAGIEPSVERAARTRWQQCLAVPQTPAVAPSPGADVPTPQVTPFSGGTRFVASEILDCVNSNYDSDLKKVRDAFIGRLGLSVSDPDVQALIQGILLPQYLDTLRAKENADIAAEDTERERRKPGVLEVLNTRLTGDLSWMSGALTAESASGLCSSAAAAAFDEYFGHVGAGERLPARFSDLSDTRANWSREVCVTVMGAPEVTQALKDREVRAWATSMTALENAVLARAQEKAADCISSNPVAKGRWVTRTIRKHRQQCLVSQENWDEIEKQALSDWGLTPEGHPFAATKSANAASHLAGHRQALQKSAIGAMESK